MSGPTKVVVIGQGYVGLPLAMRAWQCGHEVVGIDLDSGRAKQIAAGRSFTDDVLDHELTAALESGRYRVSTDPAACRDFDVALITVPTPLDESLPDLSFVEAAIGSLAVDLRAGTIVVLESSTYPGTTDEVVRPILEAGSGLKADTDFALGYSPERINPGGASPSFWQVPKLVSGAGPASLRKIEAFYSTMFDRVVPVSSPKIAELAKLMENIFRHVNIALVNEIAMFAANLDIDIWEAIDAAATKPYGFMRFLPGPGVGGHCLPVDPSYLSWRVKRRLNVAFRFVNLANEINTRMPDYVVERICLALNEDERSVRNARILLLGLAYKANTADLRESASVAVASRLLERGARLRICDPRAGESELDGLVPRVPLTQEELRWADLVVILTDHDDFDYSMIMSEARRILDTRHRTHGPQVAYL